MTRVHSVPELCEAIWDLEREGDLLSLELHGVRIWEAQRFSIYMSLAKLTGVFDTDLQTGLAQAAGGPLQTAKSLVPGAVAHSSLVDRTRADAIVVEHSRTQEVDGQRVCIYSQDLVRELTDQGHKLLLWEPPGNGPHDKTPDARRRYLDDVHVLGAARARLLPARLSARERERLHALERSIQERTGVRLPLVKRFSTAIARFQSDRALLSLRLRAARPKRLYVVVGYGTLAPLMAAAGELGIERVELQHGVISRYHLGYSYPVRPASGLRYFPDVFYSWGGVWDELMKLPLPPEQVVPYGYPHFERRKARVAHVQREPGTVLVLSQTVIGQKLAELLLRHADALAGYRIRYKLHPSERAHWRSYPALVELSRRPNVEIVEQGDLYELMARSEIQLGVFSTALYEGLAFGCRTVLAELPGLEYMQDVLDAGRAERLPQFLATLPAR